MEDKILKNVAESLSLSVVQVKNTISLYDEGASIPFIARYRKEMTKNLDEDQIEEVITKVEYFRNLEKRKEEIIRLIDEQGKLTNELKEKILASSKLQEVEDLYLPYKKKKKTKADIAIDKGLLPLTLSFLKENISFDTLLNVEAKKYLTDEVLSEEEAVEGVSLILAQMISESVKIREFLRNELYDKGFLTSNLIEKNKDEDKKQIYKDYYSFKEAIKKVPSYRVLAINRADKEKIVKQDIEIIEENYEQIQKEVFNKFFILNVEDLDIKNSHLKENKTYEFLLNIVIDSLKRLLIPSIKTEVRNILKEKSELEAIGNFSKNLKNLLLQPPLDKKTIMGLDPGYRTGCKLAIVDKFGFYKENDVLYLVEDMHTPKQLKDAKDKILKLIDKYDVDIIAIGNGTASRETESFVANVLKEYTKKEVSYIIVNEAGASVYSASKLAAEEYPDLDVTVRGTISIAKRIQDPLSELVKIDPKSIGVGMYQHDVNQKNLQESLTTSIESIVNSVGVNANTASFELLQYVSGVKKNVAKNIEEYRKTNGDFKNRQDLKNVKGLGDKAYEQMVGFIVIPESSNPLDNTIIHPESYDKAIKILEYFDSNLDELREDISLVRKKLKNANPNELSQKFDIGLETTKDILKALTEKRRDPREFIEKPILRSDILKISDLKEGMVVEGTVRNVMPFGAFVDIGLKNMGLVHISEISNKFIKNPTEVLSIGQILKVKIISIELDRERIGLSIKQV